MSIGVEENLYFCLVNLKKARKLKSLNDVIKEEFNKNQLLTEENCKSPYTEQ